MTDVPELDRFVALVNSDRGPGHGEHAWAEGLRAILLRDPDGHVVSRLAEALGRLDGVRMAGLAHRVAHRYRETGDLECLETLYAGGDAEVKESVLGALWGEPGANPLLGPGIVKLAIRGAAHPAAGVRAEACRVFMNQCARKGLDVAGALAPLLELLSDTSDEVRVQAAQAVGHLAGAKYDVGRHVAPLVLNLGHLGFQVRESAAWALWQLSRRKHDIAAAVPELAGVLARAAECSDAHKNAAGALLHHAKQSPENAARVRAGVAAVKIDLTRKALQRFANQLAALK